jgi:HSP20 family molecular chaperone IbpA
MIYEQKSKRLSPFLNGLTDLLIDEVFKVSKFNEFSFFKTKEDNEKLIYEIPLPGYDKDDIEIEVDNNTLIVKTKDSLKPTCWKSIFNYQKSLENMDGENITSKMENGILYIYIPKNKGTKNKIKIQ